VNGARIATGAGAYRPGHALANWMLSGLVSLIFGTESRDMLSGYRALSRRFVKTFPSTSSGFEIETVRGGWAWVVICGRRLVSLAETCHATLTLLRLAGTA
jgi:hypothetical protein